MIIDEVPRYIAAAEFLARRGIKPVIRRVVRWVDAVRKGKPDRKIITTRPHSSPAGSIGPVWKP